MMIMEDILTKYCYRCKHSHTENPDEGYWCRYSWCRGKKFEYAPKMPPMDFPEGSPYDIFKD